MFTQRALHVKRRGWGYGRRKKRNEVKLLDFISIRLYDPFLKQPILPSRLYYMGVELEDKKDYYLRTIYALNVVFIQILR